MAEEGVRRFDKLAEHYGLRGCPERFHSLLLFMVAHDFVPGFDVYAKGKGAPRRIAGQSETAGKVLALVMNEDGTQQVRTVSEACDILFRGKSIKDSKGQAKTADQIEADYYRFTETLAEMEAMLHDAKKVMILDKERWESRRAVLDDSQRSGTILQGAARHDPGASENSDDFS